VQCLELPSTVGEVFNLGADQPYTVKELAAAVMRCMKTEREIEYLEQRGEVLHAYSDHSKIREFFPDLPTPTDLDTGLGRMVDWARVVGPRKTKLFTEVELTRNMPPSWREELRAAGLVGD
jgi:UDP-glucose 4-epimerase